LRRVLGALVVVLASGCPSSEPDLLIDLKTDLTPGREFIRVITEYSSAPFTEDTVPRESVVEAMSGESFLDGQRIAEYTAVARGRGYVRVSLMDRDASVVVSRDVSLDIEATYALTVLLTRNCRGVTCPEPGGNPAHTTCVSGRCASPNCRPGVSGDCVVACNDSSECPVSQECAVGLCVDGECFAAALHERCEATDECDPDEGCVPRMPTTGDAGPPCAASETFCTDGEDEDCDSLTDCEDPDCLGQSCDDGTVCTDDDVCTSSGECVGATIDCDDGNECTDDSCDGGTGCQSVDNTAACDDGFWCNGTDSCQEGSCSAHADPPCAMFCNEMGRVCDACATDADCGEPSIGGWSTCGGFANTCDTTGTRSRQIMTPRCVGGSCTVEVTTENEACSRTTENTMCGSSSTGAWGGCGGFSNACDTTGTQSRTITDRRCRSGSCANVNRTESRGCSRSVAQGTRCGSAWDVCCGGTCRNLRTNANCGACGRSCPGGLSCASTGTGGYACRGCSSNAQCTSFLSGAATCYNVSSPPAWCNCQCSPSCGNNCVCAGGGCGANMFCHVVSGTNYCAPFR
jgi:hypothetical protein